MPNFHLTLTAGESSNRASERFLREHQVNHNSSHSSALAKLVSKELAIAPDDAVTRNTAAVIPLHSLDQLDPAWKRYPLSPGVLKVDLGPTVSRQGTWRENSSWHAESTKLLHCLWQGTPLTKRPTTPQQAQAAFCLLARSNPRFQSLMATADRQTVRSALQTSISVCHPNWSASKQSKFVDAAVLGLEKSLIPWEAIRIAHRRLSEYLLEITNEFPADLAFVVDLHLGANPVSHALLGGKWTLAKELNQSKSVETSTSDFRLKVDRKIGITNAILDATDDCLLSPHWSLPQLNSLHEAYSKLHERLLVPAQEEAELPGWLDEFNRQKDAIYKTVDRIQQKLQAVDGRRAPHLSKQFIEAVENAEPFLQKKYSPVVSAAAILNEKPITQNRHIQLSEVIQAYAEIAIARKNVDPTLPIEMRTADSRLSKLLARYSNALQIWNEKNSLAVKHAGQEEVSPLAVRRAKFERRVQIVSQDIQDTLQEIDPQNRVAAEFQTALKVLSQQLPRHQDHKSWTAALDLCYRIENRLARVLAQLYAHDSGCNLLAPLRHKSPREIEEMVEKVEALQCDLGTCLGEAIELFAQAKMEKMVHQSSILKATFPRTSIYKTLKESNPGVFEQCSSFLNGLPHRIEKLTNSPHYDPREEDSICQNLQELIALSRRVPRMEATSTDRRIKLRFILLEGLLKHFGQARLRGLQNSTQINRRINSETRKLLNTSSRFFCKEVKAVRAKHLSRKISKHTESLLNLWLAWTQEVSSADMASQRQLEDDVRNASKKLTALTDGSFQADHWIQTAANMLMKPNESADRDRERLASINKLFSKCGFDNLKILDFQIRPEGSIALEINKVSVPNATKWILLDAPQVTGEGNNQKYLPDQLKATINIMRNREKTNRLKILWKHPSAYCSLFLELRRIAKT